MQTVSVKVWGEYALFSRPDLKVERLSYPLMTPSAARGVLDAILFRPQMRWHVRKITVLRPDFPAGFPARVAEAVPTGSLAYGATRSREKFRPGRSTAGSRTPRARPRTWSTPPGATARRARIALNATA